VRLTLRMTASPISRMGTSVAMADGSLAELNYWRLAGSRARLMTAPHVQVIQIHSSSAPPSSSPQLVVLLKEGDKLARRSVSSPGSGSSGDAIAKGNLKLWGVIRLGPSIWDAGREGLAGRIGQDEQPLKRDGLDGVATLTESAHSDAHARSPTRTGVL